MYVSFFASLACKFAVAESELSSYAAAEYADDAEEDFTVFFSFIVVFVTYGRCNRDNGNCTPPRSPSSRSPSLAGARAAQSSEKHLHSTVGDLGLQCCDGAGIDVISRATDRLHDFCYRIDGAGHLCTATYS